jgi:hypothetical protein
MRQRVFILAVLAFLAGDTFSHAYEGDAFYSHYDGKQYKFIVTEEAQARCPKWNPQVDPNPPYPAAKALDQAQQFIATVPAKKDASWTLEYLALAEMSGGWVWRAHYQLTPRWGTGVWPTMDCIILMDGTRIQPKITGENVR